MEMYKNVKFVPILKLIHFVCLLVVIYFVESNKYIKLNS